MRKFVLRSFLTLCSLFACTACFDIQENIFFKKDGSGNFGFIIDMAQLKSMMSMFGDINLDKSNDAQNKKKSTPNERLSDEFEKTRGKLLNIEGVNNVKAIEDTANYKFGLTFDFKNISVLNKAMNKLFEEDTAAHKKDVVYFEMKNDKLIRNETVDANSILGNTKELQFDANGKKTGTSMAGFEQFFSTISYTTNYEFENKIESSKNENSLLSSNLKKVTIKCYPFAAAKDTTQKKCSIANTITFK